MSIKFTQYLRPNGRRETITVDRPQEIEDKANRIIETGFVFEAEVLTTGHVSLTVADREAEEDVAIRICTNGPIVLDKIDEMISETYERIENGTLKKKEVVS
jgi:hypothetical protein